MLASSFFAIYAGNTFIRCLSIYDNIAIKPYTKCTKRERTEPNHIQPGQTELQLTETEPS